jgi:response regulator RpfG family c-di-GMP phosphodiesterase
MLRSAPSSGQNFRDVTPSCGQNCDRWNWLAQHTKTVRTNYHGMLKNNILIVEDNQHLRKILAEIVRFYGYEVSEATTGTQAIKKAVCTRPDLILLDLGLPDMSGVEAGRAIRNDPQSAHMPITL